MTSPNNMEELATRLAKLGVDRLETEKHSQKMEEEWLVISEAVEALRTALKKIGR